MLGLVLSGGAAKGDAHIGAIRVLEEGIKPDIVVGQNFPAISSWFKILYNESRTARYRNYSFDKLKVDLLINSCLKAIVKWYNKRHPNTIHISI